MLVDAVTGAIRWCFDDVQKNDGLHGMRFLVMYIQATNCAKTPSLFDASS